MTCAGKYLVQCVVHDIEVQESSGQQNQTGHDMTMPFASGGDPV